MNLAERAKATEQVLKRFDKPFSWSGANCIRLARTQAKALGHTVPPVPLFRSALGAKRALQERGFDSVTAMLDHYFARLPAPAFARVGDLITLPAEGDELEAVCIADGTGNAFGWHGDGERLEAILQSLADAKGAWRL